MRSVLGLYNTQPCRMLTLSVACSESLQHTLSAQLVRHKAKYEDLQAGVRAQQLQASILLLLDASLALVQRH